TIRLPRLANKKETMGTDGTHGTKFLTLQIKRLAARKSQRRAVRSQQEAGPMKHSPAFLKLVEDSKTRVRETDIREVKRRLDAGDKLHLVDVREESEWALGRLPGALHLSKGVIERDIEKVIPDKSAPIVLYCGGGFRSALAADNLQKMGYSNVISMDGGWRGWTEAGYPVEDGSRK